MLSRNASQKAQHAKLQHQGQECEATVDTESLKLNGFPTFQTLPVPLCP